VLFNWYCHCQLQETCKILDKRQKSRKTQAKSFPVLQALKPVQGVLEPALDTYEQVQQSLVPSLALQNRQTSTQSFSLGQELPCSKSLDPIAVFAYQESIKAPLSNFDGMTLQSSSCRLDGYILSQRDMETSFVSPSAVRRQRSRAMVASGLKSLQQTACSSYMIAIHLLLSTTARGIPQGCFSKGLSSNYVVERKETTCLREPDA
jgi:hypothetical protein